MKNDCTMGVGDGSGTLFVRGDYDSIKAAQRIITENADLRTQLLAAQKERDEARGTIHSLTFGDLPQNVREAGIWESHTWDTMTVWEARDAVLRVLSECLKQRDEELTLTAQYSFDGLLTWYERVYTRQMCNGSNIPRARMKQNLAVLQDAVSSYRDWGRR